MQNVIIPFQNTFDLGQTLNCGQVFRYKEIENGFRLFSLDKTADITVCEKGNLLQSDDCDYFMNYLDFETDYGFIQSQCEDKGLVSSAIEFGKGIHILKQDIGETIISFVISQNNHIPRIKAIIERICEALGEDMDGYFAFPTIEKLASAGEKFYTDIGAGYRAVYLDRISKKLADTDLEEWKNLETENLRKKLMEFHGIGRKVADCVLLFGFNRFDVFPVDTWIFKIFQESYPSLSADALSKVLVEKYKDNSGFVQQWLYYFKREKKSLDK